MKKLSFLLMFIFLFNFCSTPNKLANKAFYHALIGENMMTVYARIGAPINIVTASDGGKILIYEFYKKGMFNISDLNPPTDYDFNLTNINKKTGAYYDIKVDPDNNRGKNAYYETAAYQLIVFLDNQGNCFRFEQDLPREQLEMYYDKLKVYIPKK